jgi:Ca2+/Na+ antiporter
MYLEIAVGITIAMGLSVLINIFSSAFFPKRGKTGRTIHKINGYIFIVLFAIVLVLMIVHKEKSNHTIDTLLSFHIALDSLLIIILLTKIILFRTRKAKMTVLKVMGVSIVVLFLMVVLLPIIREELAAGHNHESHQHSQTNDSAFPTLSDSELIDQYAPLFRERCTRCHTLERIYEKDRNEQAFWSDIVQEMNDKANGNIGSPEELNQILEYILYLKNNE